MSMKKSIASLLLIIFLSPLLACTKKPATPGQVPPTAEQQVQIILDKIKLYCEAGLIGVDVAQSTIQNLATDPDTFTPELQAMLLDRAGQLKQFLASAKAIATTDKEFQLTISDIAAFIGRAITEADRLIDVEAIKINDAKIKNAVVLAIQGVKAALAGFQLYLQTVKPAGVGSLLRGQPVRSWSLVYA